MKKNSFGLGLCEFSKSSSQQNSKILYLDETKSTSDYIKNNSLKDGTLVVTDHQVSGHGRRNRTWQSIPGDNFTGSWCFFQPQPPGSVFPALVGLKLVEQCQLFYPDLNWSLKAPNDIFLNGKKCAGLLIELINKDDQICVIVGLGFNVLSGPKGSEFLTSQGSAEIEKIYLLFDGFGQILKSTLRSHAQTLTTQEAEQLLEWLMKNPNFETLYGGKLKSISLNGDLVLENNVISWMDL